MNPDEPARRWAPISPLERRLEHLADYPRRTFRFVGRMHAEPDLARRSADILRAEMGEPGGAACRRRAAVRPWCGPGETTEDTNHG